MGKHATAALNMLLRKLKILHSGKRFHMDLTQMPQEFVGAALYFPAIQPLLADVYRLAKVDWNKIEEHRKKIVQHRDPKSKLTPVLDHVPLLPDNQPDMVSRRKRCPENITILDFMNTEWKPSQDKDSDSECKQPDSATDLELPENKLAHDSRIAQAASVEDRLTLCFTGVSHSSPPRRLMMIGFWGIHWYKNNRDRKSSVFRNYSRDEVHAIVGTKYNILSKPWKNLTRKQKRNFNRVAQGRRSFRIPIHGPLFSRLDI